jgi:translation initiation factor 1
MGLSQCLCRQQQLNKLVGDGSVRVSRETKGRGGKTATLVKGLALNAAALTVLAKKIKAACASGGAVKDGVIEIQGDHCDRVIALLEKDGIKAKRAGG